MSQNYEYFGKYILLEKLATGGMAEVWLARATGTGGIGKFVAIKKILPQFSDNPEFIQMFKDEATIAINLSHSNIVSIYDFGQEKQQLYLVMDYVEGRNLRQMLNKMKTTSHKFSTEQIVYLIKEAAAGLDHAHRSLNPATGKPLNITHRDMSPQNIMVSFEGEVKIVDFGIAKAESQIENTRTGTLKGKFGYMSPEQAEGHQIDLRTDIFSLGIVFWELLSNDRLFIANNEINTLKKIRECNVPSLTKINPNIHPELERISMKALTRDRNLRYQTSAALHRDLNRFLNRQYPDFSPHDFSVFIKTLYTDEIIESRNRQVAYSKIPLRQAVAKTEDEKTLVTFKQAPDMVTKSKKTDLNRNFDNTQKTEPTLTATETFSSDPGIPETSSPDISEDTVASDSQISLPDITNPSFVKSSVPSATSTESKINPSPLVLDQKLLKNSLSHQITVNPKPPMSYGEEVSKDDLVVEKFAQSRSFTARPGGTSNTAVQRTRSKPGRAANSPFNLMIFVAFMIVTYVIGTTYFPKEAARLELIARRILSSHSETASKQQPNIPTIPDLPTDPLLNKPPEHAEPVLPGINTAPLVVNSVPSGAEIYLNGMNTGQTTPSRVDVPSDAPFSITFRLERYLNYTKNDLTYDTTGKSFTATLQKSMVAYVDIDVKPPLNTRVTVNGQLLKEDILPISHYAIPSGTPIIIRAENTLTGAHAEETVTLREDQRYKIVLKLNSSRLPSSKR